MKKNKKKTLEEQDGKDILKNIPDTSVLRHYVPTNGESSHPDWLKSKFPAYINPHAGHEATGIREFSHNGHTVRVITTYRVEVDGNPVRAHLSVDEDGQVYTHATPFVTYTSATDLMKAIIEAYPESFSEQNNTHEEEHHHSHGRSE